MFYLVREREKKYLYHCKDIIIIINVHLAAISQVPYNGVFVWRIETTSIFLYLCKVSSMLYDASVERVQNKEYYFWISKEI